MKIKRLVSFGSALFLSLSSLLVISVPKAAAATMTWDGSAGDHLISTDANWEGGTAPSEDDALVFPVGAGVTDKTINNDLTAGTTFASITFEGTLADSEGSYTFGGNAFAVTGGITAIGNSSPTISANVTIDGTQAISADADSNLTISGTLNLGSEEIVFDNDGNITLSGVVSGSADITKSGSGYLVVNEENTFTGSLTVDEGILYVGDSSGMGSNSAGTTIEDGAKLHVTLPEAQKTATISEPITLNGETYSSTGIFNSGAGCGFSICDGTDITYSGTLTLGSNVRLSTNSTKMRLTGTINGSYTIKLYNGDSGTLVINSSNNNSQTPNGTYEAPVVKTTYSENSPSTDIYLGKNMTAIVTGTIGAVQVDSGGVLKGTGTVESINLGDGGTVAPGLSPGILSSGNVTMSGGTYEVELGGTASGEYDQLNVTGTVALGTETTLDTILYDDFKPTVGNTFTIINNDGSDAVTGNFADLEEGATFEVDGYVLKITYEGGSGNDVVLSVMSLPTSPDTGFGIITSNPAALAAITILASGGILIVRRKYGTISVKK